MGNDVVYIKPPVWWPEPIPEGHCLQLLKSIYGTRQAARRWHLFIPDWMEKNGYPAVNSEKTIFMRREGKDFNLHGLFVDDMMHTSTSTRLKEEFMKKYSKDFKITGDLMKSFLGMQVEQLEGDNKIKLHLDHCDYVQEMLTEYKDYHDIKKSLRPKRVPMNPGVVLRPEDLPNCHRPAQAEVLQLVCGQASVYGYVDSLRYSVPGIAARPVLCFGRPTDAGSPSSSHGVS